MSSPCIARVLVVENDLKTRSQLLEVLSRPGYMVKAASGQGPDLQMDAKKLAANFRPHVVVMDLRLIEDEYSADRSGLELLRDESFSSSRCVLHSAYLDDDHRVTRDALVEARVFDVIGKGVSPRLLINAVEEAARVDCICKREFSISWPVSWDEQTVIKTLFEEDENLPSDIVTDILGHLFPNAKSVMLKTLKATDQSSPSVFRGRSVVFQVLTDNKEPFVVKLAPRNQATKEVAAYEENIQDRLVGLFNAHLRDHKTFWELGGICYSFMGSSQKAIEPFAVFYQKQKSPEEILRPIRHFFGEVWSRHYSETQESITGDLFTAYDSFLKLGRRLGKPNDHEGQLQFPGLPGEYLNPLRWILEHKAASFISTAKQAVTHGDLHGDNLFVEEDHAWVIDFERTGPGPILRDFVELEADIVTRLVLLPANDLKLFREYAALLCTPHTPKESFRIPDGDQDEEILRSLHVIQALRSMAHEITGFRDMREYYWGLLFDTAFAVLLTKQNSTKWWRGLLYASLLCTRLSQWDAEQPLEKQPAGDDNTDQRSAGGEASVQQSSAPLSEDQTSELPSIGKFE